jgi:oligoendopeptidase F
VTISDDTALPRWDVTDLHESLQSRSYVAAHEQFGAAVERLTAFFDKHDIRGGASRHPTADDGHIADQLLTAFNDLNHEGELLEAYAYSFVSTNTFDEQAQGALGELEVVAAKSTPLTARLAEWVRRLGVEALAVHSEQVAAHVDPLQRLADRVDHQMSEPEEHLAAELSTTGSSAWSRLHSDLTSQLTAEVALPDGAQSLPMAAVRGLATSADPAVRRAAYDAEIATWPTVGTGCAAALNSIKGEANVVNRRRHWDNPLSASLFANSISRATFDAMQSAVVASLPDFRRWMRLKASLHGHAPVGTTTAAMPWWDMFAPLPYGASSITWTEGLDIVRTAFRGFGGPLAGIVDRAANERWLDAEPRTGKVGGAFCMPFVDDRSLILLNWSGSVDAAQVAAHELGHAYHNVQLADRTALQRRLPMALAETASIFCETLVVEEGLSRLDGIERLCLLDTDLIGSCQVVVDIHSRFLFETEVFARRQRRTLGVSELDELMRQAQADAYGDGLDQSTAHPYMWIVKGHYYGSHYYNWPYTYGLLFGLGLFAQYQADPDRFRGRYDDVLSRCGMASGEQLAADFGFDVTDEAFWTASLDVVRERIADYARLASTHGS